MLPRDCFHNFEQLCRPHTRDVSFVLLERIEFSFFPSEDDDWRFAPENIPPGLDVNGCNLDQKHSCQKVSTKIYRWPITRIVSVRSIRVPMDLLEVWRDFALALDLALRQQTSVHSTSANHPIGKS